MVRCPPAAPSDLLSYPGYRFPVEIISHAAWYFRFSLTLRDVEEILAERGVTVSYDNCLGVVCEIRPELCRAPAPSTSPGE